MKTQDFTTTLLVDQAPDAAFSAINNVRGWWSEEIEGGTDKLNDVFIYHYKDVHKCKMKIMEFIPGKRVVWEVMENYFSFTKDKSEWIGTKVIFDITEVAGKTQIHFTHQGLVPEYECYSICFDSWNNYMKISLRNLIATGKGQPNPKDKEREFNEQLLKQHGKTADVESPDYHTGIVVNATAQEVFDAISNVAGWWTRDWEGSLNKTGETFTVRFGEVFITMNVEEVVPGKKIVWNVTDCNKPWLRNKKEWKGTQLVWDISTKDTGTQIDFTHIGLVPGIECYGACSDAWGQYIKGSLSGLINTGSGKPAAKESKREVA